MPRGELVAGTTQLPECPRVPRTSWSVVQTSHCCWPQLFPSDSKQQSASVVNRVPISEKELPSVTCCVIFRLRFCNTIHLALEKVLSADAEPL